MIAYYFSVGTVNFLSRILYRHRLYGKKNIPKGPAVIAPNHVSHLDPAVIGAFWPGKVRFFARDTLFTGFMGWLLPKLFVYPIQRGGADIKTMRQILAFLAEGEKVVLFPEGTRSSDGQLQKPQLGAAMLAHRAGVPIIPVYVAGTYDIMPPGTKPKWSGRISTTIGKPIYPADYAHLPKKEAQQAMTDAWEKALNEMIG
jgi:1-acyl-sn-glycerol-3-phosphate acyltransferase